MNDHYSELFAEIRDFFTKKFGEGSIFTPDGASYPSSFCVRVTDKTYFSLQPSRDLEGEEYDGIHLFYTSVVSSETEIQSAVLYIKTLEQFQREYTQLKQNLDELSRDLNIALSKI